MLYAKNAMEVLDEKGTRKGTNVDLLSTDADKITTEYQNVQ